MKKLVLFNMILLIMIPAIGFAGDINKGDNIEAFVKLDSFMMEVNDTSIKPDDTPKDPKEWDSVDISSSNVDLNSLAEEGKYQAAVNIKFSLSKNDGTSGSVVRTGYIDELRDATIEKIDQADVEKIIEDVLNSVKGEYVK